MLLSGEALNNSRQQTFISTDIRYPREINAFAFDAASHDSILRDLRCEVVFFGLRVARKCFKAGESYF